MAAVPRIKLDKKEVKKGDIVEVKALVSHVMETGLRKDNDGNLVPRKILNKFVCLVAGKQVFAADFETAVSGRRVRPSRAELDRRRRLHHRGPGFDHGDLAILPRAISFGAEHG
jgi:Sulphur oxidation protein SoxZ